MFNNVGLFDRLIRFAIAGILLYLGLAVYQGSALGIGLAVFALLPALTALFGSCALYGLLGINTRSSTQHPHA
ncbi:MAG: DUF2892 domain-containing protein [Cyanobacteria bacterium P01_D01_bin.44]